MDWSRWSAAVIAAVVAAIVSFSVSFYALTGSSGLQATPSAPSSASSYDRVIKSGKIRVGFVAYPPASVVDPSTKAVTGIFPDLLREIGRITGLEVEFNEEVGWATLIEGLETGRYDILGGVWANPNRGKMATISQPVYYTSIGIWVRPDEKRFSPTGNWSSLNNESVRIAAIDGSTPLNIAKSQFPKARLVTYPNLTSESQLFLDVVQNKVDVFFAEPSVGILFLKSNPGALKDISRGQFLRVFGSVYLMKRGEPQFKTMIDTALAELQNSGVVDQLISKYEPAPGAFLRAAPPYETPPAQDAP